MSSNIASTVGKGAKTVRKPKVKGKSQKVVTRSALTSPFVIEWPSLPSGDTPKILSQVVRTFQPLQSVIGNRKCKNRKQTEKRRAEEEKDPEKKEQEQKRLRLRSQLAIGVNEVTRSLEKGVLDLVLVCRSAKPSLMTSHLPVLSATRACPAAAVFNLSEKLAPLLNMKTVLAIGFKKPSDIENQSHFADLVSFIRGKCPAIKIPWLQLQHLPPEDLVGPLSKEIFGAFKNSQDSDLQGGKNEDSFASVDMETSMITAPAEEKISKDLDRGAEALLKGATGSGKAHKNEHLQDEGFKVIEERIPQSLDGKAREPSQDASGSAHVRKSDKGAGHSLGHKNSAGKGRAAVAASVDMSNGKSQPEGTKKRKRSEISASPAKDSKKKRTAKMPFQSSNVMHVKIISKESKGKKKKNKRGKKK